MIAQGSPKRFLKEGRDFISMDLSGTSLSGADLKGTDLSGVNAINLRDCPISLPNEWLCEDRTLIRRR